jgi:hypothetical protein
MSTRIEESPCEDRTFAVDDVAPITYLQRTMLMAVLTCAMQQEELRPDGAEHHEARLQSYTAAWHEVCMLDFSMYVGNPLAVQHVSTGTVFAGKQAIESILRTLPAT